MTSDRESREVAALEESRNAGYLRDLHAKLSKEVEYGVAANSKWVGGEARAPGRDVDLDPLVGRVGLSAPTGNLPDSFYVGPRYLQTADGLTISWSAPVAQLFYRPDSADSPASLVRVRRTFDHRNDRITQATDEWAVDDHSNSPFAAAPLRVPIPPPTTARLRPGPVDDLVPNEASHLETGSGELSSSVASGLLEGMRAPQVVLARMRTPRTEKMRSVLGLLQPDQYELVSRASDTSLMVQGHPGTGKTVVAAYRAAFLADDDEQGLTRCRRVMLVGPTSEYVAHVRGLLAPLVRERRVRVVDTQSFLAEVTGLKPQLGGTIDGVQDDVDALAGQLAHRATMIINRTNGWRTGNGARAANLEAVYELIRTNGGKSGSPVAQNDEQHAWMQQLPPYARASQRRRYLPLIAQCALAIVRPAHGDCFDHIVVDEAQDVSPIEWNILDTYNRSGAWTLVGDMNQRRSDTTYASWSAVADHLGLEADDGRTLVAETLRRGYRSTQAILKFADALLPSKDRGALTVQTAGAPVTVERVNQSSPDALFAAVARKSRGLSHKHAPGTVAIIAMDPGRLFPALHQVGWRRRGGQADWVLDGNLLSLHAPESARGLEFDAVIVVEPAQFPKNLGRDGQLYTSLTRANRELVVLNHEALPDPLRKAARQ